MTKMVFIIDISVIHSTLSELYLICEQTFTEVTIYNRKLNLIKLFLVYHFKHIINTGILFHDKCVLKMQILKTNNVNPNKIIFNIVFSSFRKKNCILQKETNSCFCLV